MSWASSCLHSWTDGSFVLPGPGPLPCIIRKNNYHSEIKTSWSKLKKKAYQLSSRSSSMPVKIAWYNTWSFWLRQLFGSPILSHSMPNDHWCPIQPQSHIILLTCHSRSSIANIQIVASKRDMTDDKAGIGRWIFSTLTPQPTPTQSHQVGLNGRIHTRSSSGWALSPVGRAYGYSSPQYAGKVRCTPLRLLYHVIVQAHGPKSREHRWMKKLWGQKSAPHGDSYCVQLVGTFALCLFYTNSYHLKLLNLSSFRLTLPKKEFFSRCLWVIMIWTITIFTGHFG